MVNVHRVAISVQPQGDDRCRRRGDDGRDRCVAVPVAVVVATNADRLPAAEDTRTAKQDSIRDLVLGGSGRRSYLVNDGTVLLLHLDRPRIELEDHPVMPRFRTKVLGRGRETRFISPDRLTLGSAASWFERLVAIHNRTRDFTCSRITKISAFLRK